MRAKTDICNMALSHVGNSIELQDVDTESSAEAQACRRFYDQARDELFRAFRWPFATQIVALALVAEDPTDEWAYSYQYPSDCVTLIRILSGQRTDSRDTRVSYRIVRDATDGRRLIYTDMEDATAEYTVVVEDPNEWPADVAAAVAYRLAAMIGPRVAGGDQFRLADRALQLYAISNAAARAAAMNEEQPDVEPDASLVRGRD